VSDLYRLVYASKNFLHGTEEESSAAVKQILESAQQRNSKVGVTGALMFNAGAFAQVLEGPRRGVEETFERIQMDTRHGDVTVLQCAPAESRGFSNWSMAFVGQSARGKVLWDGIAAESGFDLSRMSGDAVFGMLHGLVIEEEGMAPVMKPPQDVVHEQHAAVALDESRIKSELEEIRPENTAARGGRQASDAMAVHTNSRPSKSKPAQRQDRASTEAALIILKAALASERERTSELRSEVDELRVALAVAQDQLIIARQECTRWAERARLLAAALCEEADEVAAIGSSEAGTDLPADDVAVEGQQIRIVA
jgi:hypothetical protein